MIEIFPVVIWVGTFPLIITRRWIVQVFLLQKLIKYSEEELSLKHSCSYIPDIPAGRLLRRTRQFDHEGPCGGSWPWLLYKPRPRTKKTKREKTTAMSEVSTASLLSQENAFPSLSRLRLCPSHKQQFVEKEEQRSKSHRHPFPNDCVGAVWQIAVLYEWSCWSWPLRGWILFLKVCAAPESRSRC